MTLYADIDFVVRTVLAEFGKSFTVSRTSLVGAVSSVTLVGIQCKKIMEEMPGSEVQIGDWEMLFTSATEPKHGDKITLNEGGHVLIRVEEIAPAGVVLGYMAWARRG